MRIAKLKSAYNSLIMSRRALAREGNYKMHPVRALVCHADFSETAIATDFSVN